MFEEKAAVSVQPRAVDRISLSPDRDFRIEARPSQLDDALEPAVSERPDFEGPVRFFGDVQNLVDSEPAREFGSQPPFSGKDISYQKIPVRIADGSIALAIDAGQGSGLDRDSLQGIALRVQNVAGKPISRFSRSMFIVCGVG